MNENSTVSPFLVQYHPHSELESLLLNEQNFAVFEFALDSQNIINDHRVSRIPLAQLTGESLVEVWSTPQAIQSGEQGSCRYYVTDTFLFVSAFFDETRFADLSHATLDAYQQISDLKKQLGFDHNVRLWNFVSDINCDRQGVERYKTFCEGRLSFLEREAMGQKNFSAATAIGSHQSGFTVISLSVRNPVVHIENPRQVSAYHYPEIYARKSPAFARATAMTAAQTDYFFISGTASILGHQSQHHGDVEKQTELSLSNIEMLLNAASQQHGIPVSMDSLTLLKVYVRNAGDMDIVKSMLQQRFSRVPATLFLHGDICRSELLVEIEALYIGTDLNSDSSG
jgi:chorismate lyase/3-hydroxybenzoate synthase